MGVAEEMVKVCQRRGAVRSESGYQTLQDRMDKEQVFSSNQSFRDRADGAVRRVLVIGAGVSGLTSDSLSHP